MISQTTMNQLLLSRHLHFLAQESLRSEMAPAMFAAVNLLQDSVEAFLRAASEHRNASVRERSDVHELFDEVEKTIAPNKLPFRSTITQLNRTRVNSKHHGIQPDKSDVKQIAVKVQEFLEEATLLVFDGADYWSVSLVDLLDERESKEYLKAAETALRDKKYEECLIECRKAVFIEFESQFDVAHFENASDKAGLGGLALFGVFCKAPAHAKNKKYIEENVREPTDFIVLDHAEMDKEIMTLGISPMIFWNIWRVTPKVYKRKDQGDDKWCVQHDFKKMDENGIDARAEYVFRNSVDLIFVKDADRRQVRVVPHRRYFLRLERPNTPYFAKADRTSIEAGRTPDGLMELDCNFKVPGLKGDGTYWHVSHHQEADKGAWIIGFIHEDDIE